MILGWGGFFKIFFNFDFLIFVKFLTLSLSLLLFQYITGWKIQCQIWWGALFFPPKFYILNFFRWEVGLVQYNEIFYSLQFILFKNIVKFFTTRNRKISVEHWFSPRTGGTRGVLRLYIPAHSSEPPNYAFFKSNDEIFLLFIGSISVASWLMSVKSPVLTVHQIYEINFIMVYSLR